MINVLITGSNSFLGTKLIDKIDQSKFKIYGIDLHKKPHYPISYLSLNLNKSKFPTNIFKNIDYVVHLGAVSNDRDCNKNLHECYETNVIGILNFIK